MPGITKFARMEVGLAGGRPLTLAEEARGVLDVDPSNTRTGVVAPSTTVGVVAASVAVVGAVTASIAVAGAATAAVDGVVTASEAVADVVDSSSRSCVGKRSIEP